MGIAVDYKEKQKNKDLDAFFSETTTIETTETIE